MCPSRPQDDINGDLGLTAGFDLGELGIGDHGRRRADGAFMPTIAIGSETEVDTELPPPAEDVPGNPLLDVVPAMVGRILNASLATGLVRVTGHRGSGTGFLISPSLLITNNHVLNGNPRTPVVTEPDQVSGTVTFGFAENMYGEELPSTSFALDPGTFFKASLEFDYAIVAVKGRPGDSWGILPLPQTPSKIEERDDVFLVQHPSGRHQVVALTENTVQEFNETLLQYSTDTDDGSSGSPVLDRSWAVVGLHHEGGRLPGAATGEEGARNQAIRADAIWSDAKKDLTKYVEPAA